MTITTSVCYCCTGPRLYICETPHRMLILLMLMGRDYFYELLPQKSLLSHPPGDIWMLRVTVDSYWPGKTEELGENPVPESRCPPQISLGSTRTWTRVSTVRRQWLTTWVMARPCPPYIPHWLTWVLTGLHGKKRLTNYLSYGTATALCFFYFSVKVYEALYLVSDPVTTERTTYFTCKSMDVMWIWKRDTWGFTRRWKYQCCNTVRTCRLDTNVSEEHIASIFRGENLLNFKTLSNE
jgi:hypothetical protein